MQITDITPKIKQRTEKIRLAAYCRVSSDSTEQLHSFATQIRYYSDYIKKNPDYELVDIYADEGLTGTEMDKRDELNRLLRDCKKGKVERIIVKSMSRFMRNTEECLITLRMLKSIGVSVYFEEQGIDTNKLNSEMIVTFPGMLAQQESENISGNLRWSISKKMKLGEFICSNPAYGYSLIDGKMTIIESEAEIIRRIFNMYLQGMGMQAIASLLNSEKIPRRNGYQTWHMTAIQYILTNEKYIGDALLQKQYTTEVLPYRQKRNHGERTMYYIENYNPPIITKEIFQAVQKLYKAKSKGKRIINEHTLSKIIKCPDCGRTFRRQVINDKAYWCCATFASNIGCKSRRVKETMIFDTFTTMVYRLKANRKEILENIIKLMEHLQQRTSDSYERVRLIDKEIADLSAKNLVITRLHTNGILGVSEYSSQTSEIANKITSLRIERRNKLNEDENDVVLNSIKNLNDMIQEYQPNGNFDEELFHQIVEKIVVEDNTCLTFYLIGGIKLTEEIKEKGRCGKL